MLFNVATTFVSLALVAQQVHAHGLVTTISFDGTNYDGFPAYSSNDQTNVIVRPMYNNGPITDVYSAAIACNGNDGNSPAKMVANVQAGASVTYTWNTWPDSHMGPITNYLASCGDGGCTSFDANNAQFFKIDESGYSNGQWAATKLIQDGLTYSFKLPANIPDGEYLLRHEILALHNVGQPQYYPSCAQIKVSGGSGGLPTSGTGKFPGIYAASDPGYTFDLYSGDASSYQIEGPAVFTGGSGSGSGSGSVSGGSATTKYSSPKSTSVGGGYLSTSAYDPAPTTSYAPAPSPTSTGKTCSTNQKREVLRRRQLRRRAMSSESVGKRAHVPAPNAGAHRARAVSMANNVRANKRGAGRARR